MVRLRHAQKLPKYLSIGGLKSQNLYKRLMGRVQNRFKAALLVKETNLRPDQAYMSASFDKTKFALANPWVHTKVPKDLEIDMCRFLRTLNIEINILVTTAFGEGFYYTRDRRIFDWVTKYLLDPDLDGVEEEFEAALTTLEDDELIDRVDGYRIRLIADFMNAINKEAYIANSQLGVTNLANQMIGQFWDLDGYTTWLDHIHRHHYKYGPKTQLVMARLRLWAYQEMCMLRCELWYQYHFAWYYQLERYYYGHQTWQSSSVLGGRAARNLVRELWVPVVEKVKYDWSKGAPVAITENVDE